MLKIKLILIATFFLLSSCSSQQPSTPIKLTTNSWIGYSPLFYANEKGWLKKANIKIFPLVSLGENMMTFKMGGFDGLTGTQFEYQKVNSQNHNLVPAIMFNRSNGGDMVLSNRSVKALETTKETVDVYLESYSVNTLVFNAFVKSHNLSHKHFNFINKDQLKIVTLIKQKTIQKPTIVVTYIPYNLEIVKHGFNVIDSTKDNPNIMVLDALYVDKNVLNQRHQDFVTLKKLVNKAINNLNENPKEYYEVVKSYIENPSYEDFNKSLKAIKWLNDELSDELLQKMNEINFQTRKLI
ncbi:ABC transporter substrate-binding protein [Thiomicrorhabdus sp. Milos-T2]|uniref:ABC transporter substrate-binding protein n=1 Tax=Thiomicrorhabdus sp. Milos-T2 TaxID=90814 RepID=UPI000493E4F9|nr:hypothetical protein [Thiomicrorhabdus sp. Milos-T2]